jgi:integrase
MARPPLRRCRAFFIGAAEKARLDGGHFRYFEMRLQTPVFDRPRQDVGLLCLESTLNATFQYMPKPPVVEDNDLQHAVEVARVTGAYGIRNAALLHVLFGTMMTPAEICKLKTDDYLKVDGTVRRKHLVRAEISYNEKPRLLYWVNPKLIASVDAYLHWRVQNGIGLGTNGRYRGLDPHSPLFHNGRSGGGFTLTKYVKDEVERESAMVLSTLYRKLFAQAGVPGQALSGRRTFAVKMKRLGKDPAVVREILGLASLSAAKEMMEGDPIELAKIVAAVF